MKVTYCQQNHIITNVNISYVQKSAKSNNWLLTLVLLNCLNFIFRHLKLELLTQFPAANDEKYFYFLKIYIFLIELLD